METYDHLRTLRTVRPCRAFPRRTCNTHRKLENNCIRTIPDQSRCCSHSIDGLRLAGSRISTNDGCPSLLRGPTTVRIRAVEVDPQKAQLICVSGFLFRLLLLWVPMLSCPGPGTSPEKNASYSLVFGPSHERPLNAIYTDKTTDRNCALLQFVSSVQTLKYAAIRNLVYNNYN